MNEKTKSILREVCDPESWSAYPGICAHLRPQPVNWNPDRREAVFAFDTEDWMGNPARSLHGGIISVIFDNAMGALGIVCLEGRYAVTVNMTVNFLRTVPLSGRVFVRVRIPKLGRTLIYTEAELALEPAFAEICATASGVYHPQEQEIP